MMTFYPAASGTDTSSVVRIHVLGKTFDGHQTRRTQMKDQDLEEPIPDSIEQRQEAIPAADEADEAQSADIPLEANEADVAEQAQGLSLEDDEYR
jgi:hypothetical protein